MSKTIGPGDCLTVKGEGEAVDKMIARCLGLNK